jgi:hypothetical protein
MPTQLKQVIGSFLTWSAYEKLAMSMTWQKDRLKWKDIVEKAKTVPKL